MFINVKQAAEILKVNNNTIRNWIADGKLKDYKERKPGKKKHYAVLKLSEVRTLKVIPKVKVEKDTNGFMTRLIRIESKIDSLIQLWK